MNALVLYPNDNVATAVSALAAGEQVSLDGVGGRIEISLLEAIPFGHKLALRDIRPGDDVIKVSSNNRIFQLMNENIDINAGDIIEGKETTQEVGGRIFEETIKVASGKQTRAEALGHAKFAIYNMGLNVL